MKKSIKIKLVDWADISTSLDRKRIAQKVIDHLSNRYEIIYSDNPDYIICNVFGHDFLNYPNAIKILLAFENTRVDWEIFDYGVGAEYITFLDRYLRIPFAFLHNDYCDINAINNRVDLIEMKSKFCSYMVSAPTKYSKRHEFFELLSKYKKVDSGGGYFNNIGGAIGNRYGDFTKSKIEWLKNYKFNICFENSKASGYLTEKIFHAFAAGCIPIYWGDPDVSRIINPKSFINIDDFKNFNEVVEKIKEIDNDDKLFSKMLHENVFLENIDYVQKSDEELKRFLYNIFDQDLDKAKRVYPNHRMEEKLKLLKRGLKPSLRDWWRTSTIKAFLRRNKKCH